MLSVNLPMRMRGVELLRDADEGDALAGRRLPSSWRSPRASGSDRSTL